MICARAVARLIPQFAVVIAGILAARPAAADLVKLTNGGEVRGRIVDNTGRTGSPVVVVQTLAGITIEVDRAELQFLTMRPVNVEEYESRARRLPDTVDAHWELAEWCREQHLSRQRDTHLQRIVELDPLHQQAQTALGRVFQEGNWIDRDAVMAARGYVKYKNRYITVQELDLIQKSADELATERQWFQKLKGWHFALTSRNPDRYQQAVVELRQIDDSHAAPAIIRYLCEDKSPELRGLGISLLSRLPGAKSAAGLVKLSLFDPEEALRYAALQGISRDDYDSAQTALIRELQNALNPVVCRAAQGLAHVGDDRAVAPLIEALVTPHRYQVESNEPALNSYSGSTDGSIGGAGSALLPPDVEVALRTGQLPQGVIIAPPIGGLKVPRKLVTVTVQQPNPDVLSTLQKLTDQNFGFDERTWRLWWAAEKNARK